nr:Ig-like domain-containing protein [Planctomycetota bacterium]
MSRSRTLCTLGAAILALAALVPACGGGGGGEAAGRGLILLSFLQDSTDNIVLNPRLTLEFSSAVDVTTVNSASIQIREGPSFGETIAGSFVVNGSTVIFEPRLPSLCDLSDSALKPDTDYRVQVIGSPAEFAVRNLAGQSVDQTRTYQFRTRLDTDPTKFADQIPGASPAVLATSPANGDAAVAVEPGNQVVINLTENLDPCSVTTASVLLRMYEIGDPTVQAGTGAHKSGFSSDGTNGGNTADQSPLDVTTWGAGGAITSLAGTPQTIPAHVELVQEFSSTRITVTPLFGFNPDPLKNASKFPENALLVVELTSDIRDFGGQSLTPQSFSFTTENLLGNNSEYVLENEGETPYIDSATTADVDSARAPSRVQGFMLFSGDGDNGADLLSNSGPNTQASGCTLPFQANDGIKDDFDPGSDVLLDTGATPNTCANQTDGSTAVVWEFQSFRIRSGITVRVVGVNPAIILVEGDVLIDSGGRLLLRGDNFGGAPEGDGLKGNDPSSGTDIAKDGGTGVAGGGNGGDATRVENNNQNWKYGHDGNAGFGSPDYDPAMPEIEPGVGDAPPAGGGEGGAPVGISTSSPWDGTSSAGGGGGHAEVGIDGQAPDKGTNWKLKLPIRSKGGSVYGDGDQRLLVPQAGSGGGASGQAKDQPWRSSTSEGTGGGSGGAGGGFIDLTASGNISIFGEVDAAGGRGGDGERWRGNSGDRGITGGGGGGSGGGIRLLTPNSIIFGGTTVVTAAGGAGGIGARHAVTRPGQIIKEDNDGGAGGNGRIAMEDSDSVIAGIGSASVTPQEGAVGFYRGVFDASRFQGGGLKPQATTEIFPTGPLNPVYEQPVQADFAAGLPTAGAPGVGKTGILVEARGFQMLPDGTPDVGSGTDWFTIGSFLDTGIEGLPTWSDGHPTVGPAAVAIPADNALATIGAGEETFARLNAQAAAGNGFEFLQL